MAVYLFENKPLCPPSFNPPKTGTTTQQIVSVYHFDINLQPIPYCKKSVLFYTAIRATAALDSVKLNDLSKNGIFVKLVDNYNPFTIKMHVGGLFLEKLLKSYCKPVKIKVAVKSERSKSKFDFISKELSLADGHAEFMLEDEDEGNLFSSIVYSKDGNGTMTIQLLESDGSPSPDFLAINKKILHDKIRSDFALTAENGKSLSCHTSFLAANSKVFETMFETDCKEAKEKACQMRLTEEGVNAFLKFMYYSDLDDAINSSSISLELLQAATEYNVTALEKAVKHILLEKPSEWYDTDAVFQLFQYALKVKGYEDLKAKAVEVIKSKPDQFRGTAACNKLFKEDPESGMELFLLLLNK